MKSLETIARAALYLSFIGSIGLIIAANMIIIPESQRMPNHHLPIVSTIDTQIVGPKIAPTPSEDATHYEPVENPWADERPIPKYRIKQNVRINVSHWDKKRFREILEHDIRSAGGYIIIDRPRIIRSVVPGWYVDRAELLLRKERGHVHPNYVAWANYVLDNPVETDEYINTEIAFDVKAKYVSNAKMANIVVVLYAVGITSFVILASLIIVTWPREKNNRR